MEKKIQELREKAIKLALAIVMIELNNGTWREEDVQHVTIDPELTLTVNFKKYGSYGAEWDDSVSLTIEEIESDFDLVVRKYKLAFLKRKEDEEFAQSQRLIQEQVKKEEKELEQYQKLHQKFGPKIP
jgi:hypothetical protein